MYPYFLQVGDPIILQFNNGAKGFLVLPRPLLGGECDDRSAAGTCTCMQEKKKSLAPDFYRRRQSSHLGSISFYIYICNNFISIIAYNILLLLLLLKKGYRREELNPHCKLYPRYKNLILCNTHTHTETFYIQAYIYNYKYKI